MKLSECTIGRIVIERRIPGDSDTQPLRIGHVVGLEENSAGEIIPTIQFARGWFGQELPAQGFHHANLEPYTD